MILTAENVHNAMIYCFLKEDEIEQYPVIVNGIATTVRFHPTRLKEYEPLINEMLLCLSDNFKQSCGGGWSINDVKRIYDNGLLFDIVGAYNCLNEFGLIDYSKK